MIVSRLWLSLSLAIAVLLNQQVFAENTKSNDETESLDRSSDIPDTNEKFNEGKINQSEEKLAKEDSTTENDAKASTEEVHEEEPAKSGEGEEKEQDGYGEGSVCVYCQYCKFCKLCERDCPCKKSKRRPNCHMCKYCKYCYLCESVCDNFCKPGSFLDTISSAVWSALPKFDNKMKGEVEKDIESVKNWIKDYL